MLVSGFADGIQIKCGVLSRADKRREPVEKLPKYRNRLPHNTLSPSSHRSSKNWHTACFYG
jgi:hypothetical protein